MVSGVQRAILRDVAAEDLARALQIVGVRVEEFGERVAVAEQPDTRPDAEDGGTRSQDQGELRIADEVDVKQPAELFVVVEPCKLAGAAAVVDLAGGRDRNAVGLARTAPDLSDGEVQPALVPSRRHGGGDVA